MHASCAGIASICKCYSTVFYMLVSLIMSYELTEDVSSVLHSTSSALPPWATIQDFVDRLLKEDSDMSLSDAA